MNLKSNIPKLFIIKISKWFMLFMPFVVPFYMDNNLEMRHVMALQAIYSIAIVLFEVPSGYLADVIGRKKTLLIGSVLGFVGFLTYSVSFGFTGFLIAEIILGLGQSLISGADSAMLYDSLLDMKREKEYLKYEGRITSSGNFAEAGAALLGGLLAGINLRYPYIGQTLVAMVAIPAAFLLTEPLRHDLKTKLKFSDIIDVVRHSLIENKELRRNIFFSSLIGTATLTMAWFVQRVFLELGIPTNITFGLLWVGLNLSVAFFSAMAYRIERKIGMLAGLTMVAVLVPGGYLLLSLPFSYYSFIIIIIFYAVRGYATPVLKDYIHRITRSNVRATVLSVRNLIIRLLFSMIGPLLGWLTDFYSTNQAFLVAGITFMVFSLMTLFFYSRSLRTGKN